MDLAGINHPAFILFKAVHDDDLPRVQATLADEPNLWARARLIYGIDFDEPQATPLMVAIRRRRLAIAHWLIDHRGSADIDEKDTDGCTALHVACEFGLVGIVRALIGAGANPLLGSAAGTPLSCAAGHKHVEAMEVLLELPRVKKNMKHVNDTLREYTQETTERVLPRPPPPLPHLRLYFLFVVVFGVEPRRMSIARGGGCGGGVGVVAKRGRTMRGRCSWRRGDGVVLGERRWRGQEVLVERRRRGQVSRRRGEGMDRRLMNDGQW